MFFRIYKLEMKGQLYLLVVGKGAFVVTLGIVVSLKQTEKRGSKNKG